MKNKFIACAFLAITLSVFTSCEKENESVDQLPAANATALDASTSINKTTTPDATNKFSYSLTTFVPNITVDAEIEDTVSVEGSTLVWEQDSTPKRNAESLKENTISKVIVNGKEVRYTKKFLQREEDAQGSNTEIVKLSNFVVKSTGARINTIQNFEVIYTQRHDYIVSLTEIDKKYGIKRRFVGSARNQSISK